MKELKINRPFQLENGDTLPEITIGYHTFGKLNESKDNVVWICHALTGNSDPTDWWSGLVGRGKLFDPDKYFIVCANMLGSCYGSTGPASINPITGKKYAADFPLITIRDMVKAHFLLRDFLNIQRIQICMGGSMGGQQALEWAVMEPQSIEKLIVLASNAQHSPWGIAFNEAQRMAIKADPSLCDGTQEAGKAGLEAARAIAMLSYRSYSTYQKTQTEGNTDKLDDFRASSYQRYQGQKLQQRFDVFSYITLSKAMDSHNIARSRKGLAEALSSIQAKTLVIGIQSDVLFPVEEQVLIANLVPGARLEIIDSIYGHDGFLVEARAIEAVVNTHIEETIYKTEKSSYRLTNGQIQTPGGPKGTGKGLGLPGTESF